MFAFALTAALALSQDEPGQPPCAQFEAAIAPINSQSTLCGITVEDNTVAVQYPDGREFPVNGHVNIPEQITPSQPVRFSVMQAGPTRLLGFVDPVGANRVHMIKRDENGDAGWVSTPVECGEYGPDHIYAYEPGAPFAFAAYSMTGHITLCALGVHQNDQHRIELSADAGIDAPLDQLRVENWYCGGEEFGPANVCFSIHTPDGTEVFRHTSD